MPREGGPRREDSHTLRPMALQGRLQIHVEPPRLPPERRRVASILCDGNRHALCGGLLADGEHHPRGTMYGGFLS